MMDATKDTTLTRVPSEDFRRAMSRFASSVTVVTVVGDDGLSYGMTATAFCSVSADPPHVLVCIKRDTATHALIEQTTSFGVNILSDAARHISDYCARPGRRKVLDESWMMPRNGSSTPVLVDCLAHVDCAVTEQIDAATHSVFIGRVRDVSFPLNGDEPLVYFSGQYRELKNGS